MIYELRTYTLVTGTEARYLQLFRDLGREIRGDRYGRLEGLWTTEFGTVGQCVHLWSYADLNERERLKEAIRQEEPRWLSEYVPNIRGMMLPNQESKILLPVDGVPLSPPGPGQHVYELRTYQLQAAMAPAWARLFKEALPARQRYSHLVGLWTADLGALNQAYHLWAYDSLDARTVARECANVDPEWQAFQKKSTEMLVSRHATILIPAEASPLR